MLVNKLTSESRREKPNEITKIQEIDENLLEITGNCCAMQEQDRTFGCTWNALNVKRTEREIDVDRRCQLALEKTSFGRFIGEKVNYSRTW